MVIDTNCEWVRPIYVSDHDIDFMSGPTQRSILSRKETWERVCVNSRLSNKLQPASTRILGK